MRRSVIWRPNLSVSGMNCAEKEKAQNHGWIWATRLARHIHAPDIPLSKHREERAFPPEPSSLELQGHRLRTVGFLSVRPWRSENSMRSLYAADEHKQIAHSGR